jgi:SM-20-related protein
MDMNRTGREGFAEQEGSTVSIRQTRSVIYEEFLSLVELNALMNYVKERRLDFKTSEVFDPDHKDDSYRRSKVLMDAGPFHKLFQERLMFYLPRILRALDHPAFEVKRIEAQITASNDGDYFRIHNDNTHANWPSREITYVYFFHREPKPFAGGDLVLYDTPLEAQGVSKLRERRRVTPRQNAIIFFKSSILHEILPMRCRDNTFDTSRFTLNGWLHR